MTDASAAKLAYRPEIDAMRALAIMMVIAFHAGVASLPGAFVGVDVFLSSLGT